MTPQRTSPTILTLFMLQRITDGGKSSQALSGKAELEKSKEQMKEVFMLPPESPYPLLLKGYQLSLPLPIRRITQSILQSVVNRHSLFKSNQGIVHIKREQFIPVTME